MIVEKKMSKLIEYYLKKNIWNKWKSLLDLELESANAFYLLHAL